MPRARNKQQLLEFGKNKFERLMQHVTDLSQDELTNKHVFDAQSVKDILAHLHEWHTMFMTWYEEGMAENDYEMPKPGYTWKDIPKINEEIYKKYADVSFEKILKDLKASHRKILGIVMKHSDEELTEKKKYAWTGSTNMASYLASATSSHYVWANDLIRKFRKRL